MKTAAVKRVWIVLLSVMSLRAQESPLQWEFSQKLQVSRPGLVELKLPESVIDRTQPSLQDLRLEGADSREVPFYLKLPQSVQSAPSAAIAAKRFAVSMEERQTLVLVETGTGKALESLSIETPSQNFLKSVTVEGSADRKAWQVLLRNHPFFSQDGASGKDLRFPKGIWPHLRVTLDESSLRAGTHRRHPGSVGRVRTGGSRARVFDSPGTNRSAARISSAVATAGQEPLSVGFGD